jgi:hypothetical protein
MTNQIPENCFDSFIKKFNEYPSIFIVEPPYRIDNFIKDALLKRHKLWVVNKIDSNGGSIMTDVLLEYDPTGILFYIKDELTIFMLCSVNKIDIVNFTISQLKKKN